MKPDIAPKPAPGGADREQLLALVNSMTDGVLALDPKFKVTLSNGAALSLLDSNSILGSGIDDVLKLSNKQGAPVALTQQIFAEPNGFTRRDWRLLYDDGTSISLFLSLSPVMFSFGGAGPGGYVLLLRDITREKSLEEERDEFISVAAHELRTPVAVAEGNISNGLLQAQREHASDEIIHALSAAHQQITFLADMLNDLSTLSRAEQGKLAMRIEEFDVGELVSSLVHDYRPAAQQKNLELVYSGDAEVGKLASSRLYVREILQNFITNAIKYTEKGSITITTERQGDGDVVVCEVVDPVEWERRGMTRGTPFALSHRFFQTGPFRAANHDERVPGLAFVGSGTLPGVGVPMVLLSGRLAADRVERMGRARS